VWPDDVFAALPGVHKAELSPTLRMIDGSVIAFKHAHHSGSSAGDNLVSANVTDAAIDELGRIKDVGNYQQVHSRVSQTGGLISTATTRKRGHWMREEIDQAAANSGGAIVLRHVDIFDNPWMPWAACWKLLITDGSITATQLEQHVLPANDISAAAREQITKPRGMIEHLGLDAPDGSLLWTEWSEDLVYPGSGSQSEIWVTRDGEAQRLLNITEHVLARHWPREVEEGKHHHKWVGADFNYHARSVVFQLFGAGQTTEEALANRKSWTALAILEVDSSGTTIAHA
jgi:hypothetical protein